MTGHENETVTSPHGFNESPQGTKRKRYVGSPRRFGGGHHSSNCSGGKNYPDTPSAPQGKRRPESERFYPSCLTGEAPEIRSSALRKVVEKETDMHKVQQRQKQVDYGKNTLGYERYCQQVKKCERRHGVHPSTPDATVKMSNRRFNGLVRAWRRTLHMYDPKNPEGQQTPNMMHKLGACVTPASEARTDTSCGSGPRMGGKVIFSPGEEDEEDDDDLNFLNNDQAPLPPLRPEQAHAPTADEAQESRTDEEGEEEGEEDRAKDMEEEEEEDIRFMDVDAADESDDDML